MLMSMNVFHQRTPNLLSVSSHGGRRTSSSHALVSSPATAVKFKPKFLHFHGIQHSSSKPVLASPATMEFNPKFLHFLPCHGFSHYSCKPFLASPATMKLSPVLFALPRDDEEFSSDNKEPIVQDDHTSISPDDVHNEQSKKVSGGEVNNGEFVVREATVTAEFYASAMLRAKGLYQYDPHDRDVGSSIVKHTVQEVDEIVTQFKERNIQPYMCIIAVRKEGENKRTGLLKYVMGTLEFSIQDPLRGKTYPEEVVTASKIKTSKFKQRKSRKYGIISKMAVAKSAGQQDVDVGSSMLKFAIESAKDKGIKQVFLLVSGDNKQALALYEKMGITILELPRDDEEFSSDNEEEPVVQDDHTSISSDDVHKEQSKKVSGDEVKKVEFIVREVTDDEERWASARLKSEVNYQYDPRECDVDSCKKNNAQQEFDKISRGYMEEGKFMCIIAVRKERENVMSGMPENRIIGTLNFEVQPMYYVEGKTYPEELVNPKTPSIFQKRGSEYGMLKRVAVDISARKQGIGRSLLKFVIEHAKENGIPHLFLHVRRDNAPALALYERMGFKIVEEVTAEPYLEMNNVYLCRLNL